MCPSPEKKMKPPPPAAKAQKPGNHDTPLSLLLLLSNRSINSPSLTPQAALTHAGLSHSTSWFLTESSYLTAILLISIQPMSPENGSSPLKK